ncbi:hypothetical protein Taro_046705 [Colocasia esculenta]|uniref:ATP-dependent Clp protease proteolytic subunit n=1 Tax=Colocasia esculenta TaxID=4460 RepID=A0A843X2T3_COLES|nr:hypothetical protein [Colocasia esculenta]
MWMRSIGVWMEKTMDFQREMLERIHQPPGGRKEEAAAFHEGPEAKFVMLGILSGRWMRKLDDDRKQVEEAFQGQKVVTVDNRHLSKGEVMDILTKVENFMEMQASETAKLIGVSDEGVDKALKFLIYGSATMAIYDVVQLVRADVSTVALGIAASTSSIILGGGTKGKRLAMPNTRIMVHQPLGGASGQAIDVEIQAKEIMHNKDNMTKIIAGFTGRTYEQVQKDIDRDRYMSPIEAVEYGIIDGVIDKDAIIQLAPVPERVKPKLNYEEISKDPRKFLIPEIPDDEIY